MRPVVLYGRCFYLFSIIQILLTFVMHFYSLVMEYADNGDVFQKICNY